MGQGHTCTVGFWPASTGNPAIDKGSPGIWSWWIPFPKYVVRPENPAAWLFLFTGFHVCYSVSWECAAGLSLLHSVRSVGGTGSHLSLPKSADLEPALPQGLLCLLSLILCLYPSFHPFSVVMDKTFAGCGRGLSH